MSTEAGKVVDREGSPDQDFGIVDNGKEVEDQESSDSSDESDDDESGTRKKKRKEEELIELEDDEAKALQEDLGSDIRQGKRIRRSAIEGKGEDENGNTAAKQGPSLQSDEVWKSIQSKSGEKVFQTTEKEEMILVKRTYRFAGELVNEEKMLPISHPEAKEYLAKEAEKEKNKSNPITQSNRPLPSLSSGPRRKKAGGLAAMSAAVTGKPTKLNTLEKSKMDWNKFKDSSLGENERHEMEQQTKGGSSGLGSMKGYMERKDFLDRVQNRLEGQEKKG